METGLAKLRALEVLGLRADELADIRWRNATRLFPPHSFPTLDAEFDGVSSATRSLTPHPAHD
jgi:hypothetical protein